MTLLERLVSEGRKPSVRTTLVGCFATALQPVLVGNVGIQVHPALNFGIQSFSSSQEGSEDMVHRGTKSVLRSLLADGPRTSKELWDHAEQHGVKSKRFMKMMLKQMRQRGEISTSPPKRGSENEAHHGFLNFVYSKTQHDASD